MGRFDDEDGRVLVDTKLAKGNGKEDVNGEEERSVLGPKKVTGRGGRAKFAKRINPNAART